MRSSGTCNAIMLACPADVFPKNVVGSIWGLVSEGSDFGGTVFALFTGSVVDHLSYLPVFIGFGTVPLIGAGIPLALVSPVLPPLSCSPFGVTS
jgi:sugar phosphate permease